MPTLKQQELAKALIENAKNGDGKTAGEILVNIGYSEATAKGIPKEIIGSEGVREALEQYGFTEDNAKRVVTEILNDKRKDANARLKAADMTFKVHGSYAPEKSVNVTATVTGDVKDFEKYQALKDEFETKLLDTLQSET